MKSYLKNVAAVEDRTKNDTFGVNVKLRNFLFITVEFFLRYQKNTDTRRKEVLFFFDSIY